MQGACQSAYSDLVYYPRWFCEFLIMIFSLIALRDAAHCPIRNGDFSPACGSSTAPRGWHGLVSVWARFRLGSCLATKPPAVVRDWDGPIFPRVAHRLNRLGGWSPLAGDEERARPRLPFSARPRGIALPRNRPQAGSYLRRPAFCST